MGPSSVWLLSLVLAGRCRGHKDGAARKAAEACMVRYCEQMRVFTRMPLIQIGKFLVHRIDLAVPVLAALAKAERATPQHIFEQLTRPSSPRPEAPRRFKDLKPMLTRITGSRAAAILGSLIPYRAMLEPQRQHLLSFYRPVDVGFKVVGTGSVGLRDYVIYMEGNGPSDPLFLQIKEETASAYAPYLPDAHPAAHNGQRVAEGQRAMQIQTDPFLGWTHIGARQYLVRQLNDHKGSIEIDDLAGGNLKAYGAGLRRAAGARPCPLRRPAGHHRLHRQRRSVYQSAGRFRCCLRRPDGKGLGAVEEVGQSGEDGVRAVFLSEGSQSPDRVSRAIVKLPTCRHPSGA